MPEPSPVTRFGLIRHAQTEWNVEKRIQGHQDSPLTPEGRQQALRWGHLLKSISWERIVASDTGRAMHTAVQINNTLQLPFETDKRFREQDWGLWTEMTEQQLQQDYPQDLSEQMAKGWNFCPPGGETRQQVWSRSSTALSDSASRWPGSTILIVTHEGVIRSLIYHLNGRKFLPQEPPLILPYHLHWLVQTSDRLMLDRINALSLM